MENFNPWESLIGGLLIGASVSLMWILNGQIAGISNIFFRLFKPLKSDNFWQYSFILGLLCGGEVMYWLFPQNYSMDVSFSQSTVAIAGLFVGSGTLLANGCTSGHGICGNSRLSRRSMVATVTFITAGIVTVWMIKVILGGMI